MFLMFQDKEVLWFQDKTFREVKIINEKFLPFSFRGLVMVSILVIVNEIKRRSGRKQ